MECLMAVINRVISVACYFINFFFDIFFCLSREQYDTVFELICMAFNVGLWYTKHAAKLAGKEEWVLYMIHT